MQLRAQREEDLHEGQYDVVVVIPSYDEGYRFLRMLESVAVQEGIDDVRLAVLVVLNNAAGARAEVRSGNARGQRLIEALWTNEPPEDLRENTEVYSISPKMRIEAFRTAAASRAKLLLLDLFSEGHAPEECNVGIARDEGGRAAARLLTERGVIAFTDADSWYKQKYMAGLRRAYAAGADAATGPIETFPGEDVESIHAEELRETESRLRRAQRLLQHGLGVTDILRPEATHMMPGANLTVRREEFLAAGGIDHVAGGEDIGFACKVVNRGKTIAYDEDMIVVTPGRVSLRTHVDHGYGQRIAERIEHIADFGSYMVMGMRGRRLADGIVRHMHEARDLHADDEAAWKAHMAAFRFSDEAGETPPLLPEEIDALWREYRRAPGIPRLEDNDFIFRATERLARSRTPDTRLIMALGETEGAMVNAEDEPGAPQTATDFFGLRAGAQPILTELRAEAARRADEMAEEREWPRAIGRMVFGLPYDENSARNQPVVNRSYDVLLAAALKCDERRLGEFAGLAMETAADLPSDADAETRAVLAEIPGVTGRLLAAQVYDGALNRLLDESYEALRVDPEGQEPLRVLLEPAIDPLLRRIGEEMAACVPFASRLYAAKDALLALAGDRRDEMNRGIAAVLAAVTEVQTGNTERWARFVAGPGSAE